MEARKLPRLSLIGPVLAALIAALEARAAAPVPAPSPPEAEPPPAGAEPPPVEAEVGAAPEPQEVIVAGTRARDTSGSAHVIRPKQLERFEHDDPHQVLLGVPGVYVRGEDGFGLRPNIGMRGAISDRSKKVTLMEDGVLFGPAPYSAPAAYYFPLITRMYSVRVLKGPSAIVVGPHTVAGAIDLVTAPIPDGRKAMIDVAFGQYLSRKVHARAGLSDDTLGILIEGVHLGNAGFKVLDGDGDADTGFSRNEWMAKARYALGGRDGIYQELELKAGYSSEDSNETYLGLTDADFEADPYRRYAASRLDRMEWHRTALALTHRLRGGADLEVVTTAYRHDLDRVWRKVNGFRGAPLAEVLADPGTPRNAVFHGVLTGAIPATTSDEALLIGPNDRRFVSQGVQAALRWTPQTGPVSHRVELGTRLHHDAVQRLHSEDGFLVDGAALVPDGEPTATTADNEASTLALALHVIDAATWGPVTLTTGARIESIHGELEDHLTGRREGIIQQVALPGAGVFVALPLDLGVLAGVHQGFSPIPPGQSEQVRPEKSVNYEWGLRWAPRRVRVEVIGFHNDYKNLSNVCTFSSGCTSEDLDQQFDGGTAIVQGLEGYIESELEVAEGIGLPGRLAYTLTRARFSSAFESADPIFGDVEDGDHIPYIPTHQLSASIGVETGLLSANVAGTYVSAMREIAGQGEPAPGEATDAHFVLDASAGVKALPSLTIYAVGRNLLDSVYIASRRPFGARPGAPLQLQLGAKLEL